METFLHFLIIYALYISSNSSILGGITYTRKFNLKYLAVSPQKTFNLSNWCFFITEKKHTYFWSIYLFFLLHLVFFSFFLWLWILVWKNYWYLIPFITTFCLFTGVMIVKTVTYQREIQNFGYYELKTAFKRFVLLNQDYMKKKSLQIEDQQKLTITKDNKPSKYQKVINFQDRKFMRRVKKVKTSGRPENIVLVFNLYLSGWSYLITAFNSPRYSFLLNNEKISYEMLSTILLNKFFQFYNER